MARGQEKLFGERRVSVSERRLKRLERGLDYVLEETAIIRHMLRQVMGALNLSINMEIAMNQDLRQELDNLKAEVEQTSGDYESFRRYMAGVTQHLQALADSQSDATAMRKEIREYADALNAKQAEFAQAIAASPQPGGQGGGGGGSEGGVPQGSEGGVGAGTTGSEGGVRGSEGGVRGSEGGVR